MKMFGPSVFGLTFSELFSSVLVRAASARIIFRLFGLRVDLETIIIFKFDVRTHLSKRQTKRCLFLIVASRRGFCLELHLSWSSCNIPMQSASQKVSQAQPYQIDYSISADPLGPTSMWDDVLCSAAPPVVLPRASHCLSKRFQKWYRKRIWTSNGPPMAILEHQNSTKNWILETSTSRSEETLPNYIFSGTFKKYMKKWPC